MGFCVKCGKKGIEGSLCSECFKEENPVLKEFKEMRIEVCRNCKAYRHHGRWYDTNSLKDAVKRVALESVKKAGTNVKPEINAAFDEDIKREKKKDINIEVSYGDEAYNLPCRLIFQDCPRCSKQKSTYFEAVLQLRNPKEDIINFIEKRIEKNKAKGIFLTDKKREGDGWDFYVTNKTFAIHLGRLLQERFFGILKISTRLFTRDKNTQKDVYRVSVLFQMLDKKPGDIIKVGEDDTKILEARGDRVQGQDMRTRKKVFVDYKLLMDL